MKELTNNNTIDHIIQNYSIPFKSRNFNISTSLAAERLTIRLTEEKSIKSYSKSLTITDLTKLKTFEDTASLIDAQVVFTKSIEDNRVKLGDVRPDGLTVLINDLEISLDLKPDELDYSVVDRIDRVLALLFEKDKEIELLKSKVSELSESIEKVSSYSKEGVESQKVINQQIEKRIDKLVVKNAKRKKKQKEQGSVLEKVTGGNEKLENELTGLNTKVDKLTRDMDRVDRISEDINKLKRRLYSKTRAFV
jgi:hypothetical protein